MARLWPADRVLSALPSWAGANRLPVLLEPAPGAIRRPAVNAVLIVARTAAAGGVPPVITGQPGTPGSGWAQRLG
jgi:hypothetical protein